MQKTGDEGIRTPTGRFLQFIASRLVAPLLEPAALPGYATSPHHNRMTVTYLNVPGGSERKLYIASGVPVLQRTMSDDIPSHQYFYAEDGTVITGLEDLYEKVEHLDEDAFRRHQERGDFRRWIQDVFGEHILARNIDDAETRQELMRYVFVRLFT